MKKRILCITIIFSLFLVGAAFLVSGLSKDKTGKDVRSEEILMANEIARLIDAGGYTIRYAADLLGKTAEIRYAQLNYLDEFEVDIYGSAALVNEEGVTAQIAFGMDNDYKCELEVWGSKGTIKTGRILTAPAGFTPTVTIKKNTETEERPLPADDAFRKSIEYFVKCVTDPDAREENYQKIKSKT